MELKFPQKSKGLTTFNEKLILFLTTIIDMSNSHKPPGRNASNGWFRALMVSPPSNPEFNLSMPYTRQIVLLNESELDEECKVLYQITKRFIDDFIGGFQAYDNVNGNEICWDLIIDGALSLVDDFARFIFDDPNASESLKNQVRNLYRSYTQECISSGQHMNGHISTTSKNSASNALASLSSNNFTGITTDKGFPVDSSITEAKMVADLLRVTFNAIANLSTENHNPWLRAEWQLSITVLLQSCLTSLTSLQKLFNLSNS